jgi:hypothetical protein
MAKEVSQGIEIIARALELSVIVRELMDLQVADKKHIAMGVSGRAQKAALGLIGMRNRNSSSNKIKDEKNVTVVERIVESLIVHQSQW